MQHEGHHHERSGLERRFLWCLILNGGLAIGEIAASVVTGSSALLADGLMNVDDVSALTLSIYSEKKTKQAPDELRTFGYKRMDAFAGFAKGCLLLVSAFLVLLQAGRLLLEPQAIAGNVVIAIGAIALAVNLFSAFLLEKDACHSLNARSTYACMAYDAVGSFAAIVSGILSRMYEVPYFDVAAALLIALFMVKTGFGVFREGMLLFLQTAPAGFDFDAFERMVLGIKGVSSVGDIHVWSLTPTEHYLTCKVTLEKLDICDCERILFAVERICRETFHIEHVTIQPVYAAEELQRFCGIRPPPREERS